MVTPIIITKFKSSKFSTNFDEKTFYLPQKLTNLQKYLELKQIIMNYYTIII